MLRKKLIAFGLVGITTFGTITGNTAIVLASPTKAKASDNMIQGILYCAMNRLEKFINEGQHNMAITWQDQLKDRLKVLSDLGEDTKDLQRKFDKLSRQINLLKAKNKKIEFLEKSINNSIETIESLLNKKDYKKIPKQFKTIYKCIDKLSKYKYIDKTTRNKIGTLEYMYKYREEMTELASMLIEAIDSQLDDLSKVIKEKNIDEAISIRKGLQSDIKKLAELLEVPESITYIFKQYSEKLDKLINFSKEDIRLQN